MMTVREMVRYTLFFGALLLAILITAASMAGCAHANAPKDPLPVVQATGESAVRIEGAATELLRVAIAIREEAPAPAVVRESKAVDVVAATLQIEAVRLREIQKALVALEAQARADVEKLQKELEAERSAAVTKLQAMYRKIMFGCILGIVASVAIAYFFKAVKEAFVLGGISALAGTLTLALIYFGKPIAWVGLAIFILTMLSGLVFAAWRFRQSARNLANGIEGMQPNDTQKQTLNRVQHDAGVADVVAAIRGKPIKVL